MWYMNITHGDFTLHIDITIITQLIVLQIYQCGKTKHELAM